jgi:murein DD-endopeptidase MepM/ murein hydrolase activator NlpD
MAVQPSNARQLISLLAAVIIALLPSVAKAQADYGQRIPSRDNRWLTPVASRLLSSDEHMHRGRGSVDAWDISAPLGSPIYSMGPGRVIVANCGNAGVFLIN